MSTPTIASPASSVTADDITWDLSPAATIPWNPDDLVLEVLLDGESYRAVARAAIQHAHVLHEELTRLQCAHRRLLDEYRRLRRPTHTGEAPAA